MTDRSALTTLREYDRVWSLLRGPADQFRARDPSLRGFFASVSPDRLAVGCAYPHGRTEPRASGHVLWALWPEASYSAPLSNGLLTPALLD